MESLAKPEEKCDLCGSEDWESRGIVAPEIARGEKLRPDGWQVGKVCWSEWHNRRFTEVTRMGDTEVTYAPEHCPACSSNSKDVRRDLSLDTAGPDHQERLVKCWSEWHGPFKGCKTCKTTERDLVEPMVWKWDLPQKMQNRLPKSLNYLRCPDPWHPEGDWKEKQARVAQELLTAARIPPVVLAEELVVERGIELSDLECFELVVQAHWSGKPVDFQGKAISAAHRTVLEKYFMYGARRRPADVVSFGEGEDD